jgi:hypothetical protein
LYEARDARCHAPSIEGIAGEGSLAVRRAGDAYCKCLLQMYRETCGCFPLAELASGATPRLHLAACNRTCILATRGIHALRQQCRRGLYRRDRKVSGDAGLGSVRENFGYLSQYTSYAERNILNLRMHSRRMTRLTHAFSKKMENTLTLWRFTSYITISLQFRLHSSGAHAAGVTTRLWEIGDVVDVLKVWEGRKRFCAVLPPTAAPGPASRTRVFHSIRRGAR